MHRDSEVVAAELGTLVDVQVDRLHGREVLPGRLDGNEFAHLQVEDGRWRRDGTALTRLVLHDMLAAWRTAVPTARGTHLSQTLGLVWGVTSFLTSKASAGRAARPKPVSAQAVLKWQREVLEHPSVQEAALASLARFGLHMRAFPPTGATSSDPWSGTWPLWPVSTAMFADWTRLARAIPDLADVSDEELVLALRRYLGRRLTGPFAASAPENRLRRHIVHGVLRPWSVDDVVWFSPFPVDQVQGGGGNNPQVVAILQMLAFDALLADRAHLVAALTDRRQAMRLDHLARVGGLQALTTTATAELQEVVARLQAEGLRTEVRMLKPPPELTAFLFADRMNAKLALAMSFAILQAEVPVRKMLIHRYVELREGPAPAPDSNDAAIRIMAGAPHAMNETERTLLGIADQSVRLQAVHLRLRELVRRLTALAPAEGGTTPYVHLGPRDVALTFSKEHDAQRGLGIMSEVRDAAQVDLERPGLADPLDALETLQQVTLSLAGAFLTAIEDVICHTKRPADIPASMPQLTRGAQHWSRQALVLLATLENDHGLATARLGDGRHISSVNWIETALQVRLRILVALMTAVRCNLGDGGTAESSRIWLASAWEETENIYRQLFGSANPSNSGVVGMQGTWLAMLSGGKVPYVDSVGAFDLELRFLDGDPESSDRQTSPTVQLDVDESARWHVLVKRDAGILGAIDPDAIAWKKLNAFSDGNFALWFEQVGPARVAEGPSDRG